MNSKVILIIQLALMGLFFYLLFGVFDAKQTSGLIGIGASMAIIFGIVLFLEKIKEKMNQAATFETPLEQTASPVTPTAPQTQSATPVPSTTSPTPQTTTQPAPTPSNSQTASPLQQQPK